MSFDKMLQDLDHALVGYVVVYVLLHRIKKDVHVVYVQFLPLVNLAEQLTELCILFGVLGYLEPTSVYEPHNDTAVAVLILPYMFLRNLVLEPPKALFHLAYDAAHKVVEVLFAKQLLFCIQ